MWVLEVEPESSRRVASALNQSLTPVVFLKGSDNGCPHSRNCAEKVQRQAPLYY